MEGFDSLSRLAYDEAGLVLSEQKAPLIVSRLRHRMKALSLSSLSEYCTFVQSDSSGVEHSHMISALTTNVSGFFREPHHFDKLRNEILPDLMERLLAGNRARIWSAGCSNGQEPYSIAMECLRFDSNISNLDFKILATDIDVEVLKYASEGTYDASQLNGLDQVKYGRYFKKVSSNAGVAAKQVTTDVRSLVSFKRLNLIDKWPMNGFFDVIFCRNVVIYFDADTQKILWKKFEKLLHPNGTLFVGHSERVDSACFTIEGATSYKLTSQKDACGQHTYEKDNEIGA